MLKETITYEDFDDVPRTETLYFNLTKSELVDHLYLKDEFESLQKEIGGVERELSMPEVQKILDLVKTFMRLSYGERSDDGRRFMKNDGTLFEEFKQTAAYDAFLMGLFQNPEKAVDFLIGVMPRSLKEEAEAEMKKSGQELPEKPTETVELSPAAPVLESEKSDDAEKKWTDYTRAQLLDMSTDEFNKLAGNDPLKMDPGLLQIAYQRKNNENQARQSGL